MPCVFVTKGQQLPAGLKEIASSGGRPAHSHRAQDDTSSTGASSRGSKMEFAPTTTLHGSLADVFGVGLLFTGKSGIGKSECVLDLVERGHRLVADDLVIASKRGNDVLIGRGHELQRHYMEIRGVGLVDIPAIFGIRAVRQQKRIEVVVQLEEWDQHAVVDRTGLDGETTTILDVELPKIRCPLNPGKNITVIAEVIAMNHLLKLHGDHDPPKRSTSGCIEHMKAAAAENVRRVSRRKTMSDDAGTAPKAARDRRRSRRLRRRARVGGRADHADVATSFVCLSNAGAERRGHRGARCATRSHETGAR